MADMGAKRTLAGVGVLVRLGVQRKACIRSISYDLQTPQDDRHDRRAVFDEPFEPTAFFRLPCSRKRGPPSEGKHAERRGCGKMT